MPSMQAAEWVRGGWVVWYLLFGEFTVFVEEKDDVWRRVPMFKLGQDVKFKKCYVKAGESVSNEVDYMSKEHKRKWEEGEDIYIRKLKINDLGEYKSGIVVGKRNVGVSSLLTWYDNEYVSNPHWRSIETTYEKVYLVATNLRGFYKVPENELHSLN